MNNENKIKLFYNILLKEYGPQNWWPSESRTECILGAILTQNTSWNNVEKALKNLKKSNLINFRKLEEINHRKLADTIRPSGYYNQKTATIKNFIKLLSGDYNMNLDEMSDEKLPVLREKLLNLKGIGNETADTILLYAFNKPSFVIDNYTYRLLYRHKLINQKAKYKDMQKLIKNNVKRNTKLFNEYHALIVKVGKKQCKKIPNCNSCPLQFDID